LDAPIRLGSMVDTQQDGSPVRKWAPALSPRTWYGMPAHAKDGNVVCFFKCADKFKNRYATLGFSDKAKLHENSMWPTEFALRICALIKKR
jgi:uncharacterized protein YdhG (YjbR/CyaY superfamily)